MNISERDFVLLQQIQHLQQEGRLNVEEMAARLKMTPSALVRRLKTLQEAGWVERRQETSPRGRAVYYVPTPRISVQWVSPRNGVALSWSTQGEMDWDFPLVSQVPDADARQTLRRFLWALRELDSIDREVLAWSDDGPVDKRRGSEVAIVVFGSAARGAARKDSDVDVLVVVGSAQSEDIEKIPDAAAAVSLESPRPLQVKAVTSGDVPRLPKEIRSAVSQDGLIVHDTLFAPEVWGLVYGSRRG